MKDEELAIAVDTIARKAGAVILAIYDRDFKIETKSDNSPVTEADQAAATRPQNPGSSADLLVSTSFVKNTS